jgi:hypothetical protein
MLFIIKCYKFINLYCKNVKAIKILSASEWGNNGKILLSDNNICFVGNNKEYIKEKDICSLFIINNPKIKNKNVINKKIVLKNIDVDYSHLNKHEILRVFIETTNNYPTQKICNKLFIIVKEVVEAYNNGILNDEENIISNYTSLPMWKWDYSRLTNNGEIYNNLYKKIINGEKITPKEEKLKLKIINGKYSEYFSNLFSNIKKY